MVRKVTALVFQTMAAMDVDVLVVRGAPALPAPVITTAVAVPAPAALGAPVASSGRAAPAPAVAPMADAVFAVDVVLVAPVRPEPEPLMPVALNVASVAPGTNGNYRVITLIYKKYGNLPLCLENYASFSLPPIFTNNLYTYTLSYIINL